MLMECWQVSPFYAALSLLRLVALAAAKAHPPEPFLQVERVGRANGPVTKEATDARRPCVPEDRSRRQFQGVGDQGHRDRDRTRGQDPAPYRVVRGRRDPGSRAGRQSDTVPSQPQGRLPRRGVSASLEAVNGAASLQTATAKIGSAYRP